jgi:hypothetical protein
MALVQIGSLKATVAQAFVDSTSYAMFMPEKRATCKRIPNGSLAVMKTNPYRAKQASTVNQ